MINERFSLTLVVSHLGLGGTQRAVANLATYWAENTNWHITLLVVCGAQGVIRYPIPERVVVQQLYRTPDERRWSGVCGVFEDIRRLRRHLSAHKSSLVISFMDTVNVRTILALVWLRIPHIITEHAMPSNLRERGRLWGLLRKWVYGGTPLVVPSAYLSVYYGTLAGKTPTVIGNPILIPSSTVIEREEKHFIGAGRFEQEKGFDLLIAAFAVVYQKYPDARLTLFGSGSQLPILRQMIEQNGLQLAVSLRAPTSDLCAIYGRAFAAVIPSRREAFGNAIVEAMAHRVPVIVSDCVSGPREIIKSKQAGIVVPRENVRALSEAMLMLIEDTWLGAYLAANAAEAIGRYDIEAVAGQWRSMMHGALNRSRHWRARYD